MHSKRAYHKIIVKKTDKILWLLYLHNLESMNINREQTINKYPFKAKEKKCLKRKTQMSKLKATTKKYSNRVKRLPDLNILKDAVSF